METQGQTEEGEYAGDTPTTGPLTDWELALMRSTELPVSGLDPILYQPESPVLAGIARVFDQTKQPNA